MDALKKFILVDENGNKVSAPMSETAAQQLQMKLIQESTGKGDAQTYNLKEYLVG